MLRTFGGLLLCVALLAVISPTHAAAAGRRVRIVTFNVEMLAAPGEQVRLEKYRWDYARRLQFERIAAIVEALDPDVLNLVEVTSAAAVEHLVGLLHEKGMTDYRGYHIEGHEPFTGFDVACISKIAPDEIEGARIRNFFTPSGDATWRAPYSFVDDGGVTRDRETGLVRQAVYCLTIGQHKLGLLGLHLKSNPDDAYSNGRRAAEAQIAQRIVQREIVARGYTPIVLGDLNDYDPDVPDRDESRSTQTNVLATLKEHDAAHDGPELVNVAQRMPRVADRYTSHWDRNENRTDDPGDVHTMIDHILLDHRLMPHVRRAFIAHTHNLETSDHFPVVVDLELPE